jgi:hypothetical protein
MRLQHNADTKPTQSLSQLKVRASIVLLAARAQRNASTNSRQRLKACICQQALQHCEQAPQCAWQPVLIAQRREKRERRCA